MYKLATSGKEECQTIAYHVTLLIATATLMSMVGQPYFLYPMTLETLTCATDTGDTHMCNRHWFVSSLCG